MALNTKNNIFSGTVRRKNQGESITPIHGWKLVYSPNNTFFDELLGNVSNLLALDGVIGVPTPKDVESIMTSDQLLAGIVFHHLAVRYSLIYQTKKKNVLYSIPQFIFRRTSPNCRRHFSIHCDFQVKCVRSQHIQVRQF